MSKPDGGPAFPTDQTEYMHEKSCVSGGMTLRDWFAGQAVARLIPEDGLYPDSDKPAWKGGPLAKDMRERELEKLATDSYAAADAMLAERVK